MLLFCSPKSTVATAVLLLASSGLAAPPADPLDAAMAKMDQAAASFKGLTADIRKTTHTDVLNVDDAQSGTISVKRSKPGDTRIRIDFTEPAKQSVAIGGGKAVSYTPSNNEAQEVDLGKKRGLVDQFMLLGFGSNAADLKSAYAVTLGGPDKVNGEAATRLVLVPKDKDVLAQVKQCELWISEKGITLQQKFHTGGKDYVVSTYSRMNLNPAIADKDVKLDLPKGVKVNVLK